jgi:multiple sugar transport system substrate-binding protein
MGAGLTGALVLGLIPASNAASASIGSACAKVGAKAKAGKVRVTCKSASGRLVWTDTKLRTVSVLANAIQGGKSSTQAEWIQQYITPNFVRDEARKGLTVKVNFTGKGIADEDFKAGLALDLLSKRGADLLNIDGIWVGEFADAGYIKPLSKVVGKSYASWDGWTQIDPAVADMMSYQGQKYGIPSGTDGRVLYFNKEVFATAGLPSDWQPKSWAEVLAAAKTIKAKVPNVTPLQMNAGTAMGEATTMQGVLPLLVGTGERIYDDKTGKWTGNTAGLRQVLQFYSDVYGGGLGNKDWQISADGRDQSFSAFAQKKVGILAEGDYGWRGIWDPISGDFKMADRNTEIGYALIPAVSAGKGIRGQNFVSMSGGGGFVLNPNTKQSAIAWDLLTFMNSRDAVQAFVAGQPRITQRTDVNSFLTRRDPLMNFVASKVMPFTAYRPGFAIYPQVSVALQQATLDVINGDSVAKAAATYEASLVKLVGSQKVKSN